MDCARIFQNVQDLKSHLDSNHPNKRLIVTSGGFDPIHLGHIQCILGSSSLKKGNELLAVICNSNEWLKRKKGYALMPENDRLSIVSAIRGVDFVVVFDDGSPTVCGALETLKPQIFAKGGDRNSSKNVPEFDVCEKIGCEVKFNIGGGKIQSSSKIVSDYHQEIISK